MDKKSLPETDQTKANKIFFILVFLLIIGSVAVTYYRIMVKKDYIISAQTDCDPTIEKCFIWECDPTSIVEGEACIGDPESDIWYYKIIKRKAANIPTCDPNDENCEALVCVEGEKDCEEILCSPETATAGETCNDPEQYNLENPAEDDAEETACDSETDETCIEEASEDEIVENEIGTENEEATADDNAETVMDEEAGTETVPVDEAGAVVQEYAE